VDTQSSRWRKWSQKCWAQNGVSSLCRNRVGGGCVACVEELGESFPAAGRNGTLADASGFGFPDNDSTEKPPTPRMPADSPRRRRSVPGPPDVDGEAGRGHPLRRFITGEVWDFRCVHFYLFVVLVLNDCPNSQTNRTSSVNLHPVPTDPPTPPASLSKAAFPSQLDDSAQVRGRQYKDHSVHRAQHDAKIRQCPAAILRRILM